MSRRTVILLLVLVALPRLAAAQYPFGKNKVAYTSRDWKVLATEHVDIYYYPDEQSIVAFVAPLVESTYEEYSKAFKIEFRDRLPLVFYSSHYDFQQTNIVPSLISDYTAGFTDLMKGRIAIPMTGSLWQLRHVIRHEMVHAFMLEKIAIVMSNAGRFTYSQPPLWFVEGMAEYFASPKANTQSRMFVRDALMNGNLPDLTQIWRIEGSFMMYKEGEAVVRYIATNYGDKSVIAILENWWKADDFTFVLQATINMSLLQLNDKFMNNLKRRYYPEIMYRTFAPEISRQLTPPHSFHARPAAGTLDGETTIYSLFAHDGMVAIGCLEPNDHHGLDQKTLIEGGRSTAFESIPAFRSKIEVHGDTLLFVAKRQGQDAIYLWSRSKNKVIDWYTFPGLSIISSPTLSRDKDMIAFTSIDASGLNDLFVYYRDEDRLVRMTNDPYSEEDPDFHPSADVVLFSSDRCENGDAEYAGIYEVDLHSGLITALTCGSHSDTQPEWLDDGHRFLFTSDRDGAFDIYLYDYDTRMIMRQSNVMGGVTSAAALPGDEGFVAAGYYRGEYQLFQFPLKTDVIAQPTSVSRVDSVHVSWVSRDPQDFEYESRDYKQKLGLDFAAAGVAIDPDFGSLGNGAEVVMSDILGNHQYYFFFGNTSSEVSGNFFKNLNVGVNYVNLSHRINYSLGLFHLTSTTGDFFTAYRSERRYGIATGLRYPFSKFSRIDGSVVLRFVEREADYTPLTQQKSLLATTFLTYAVDNTLWTLGGPLKGWRYYLTAGHTFDFQNRGFDNTTVQLDLRKYHRITRRIVFAQRFITRHSFGGDFQIFYLGGPWDLRGYDFREFFGRSIYLINNEVRFPLIDRFSLSLPFGTLETPLMRGSLLFDAGRVNRYIIDSEWLGTVGAGVELNLGYAPVIRVNFTRATDFHTISTETNWELFIGFNY